LAESLAQNRGYTFYQAPLYAPSNVWPPVFPFFLSLVMRAFGPDLLALKLAMVLLGVATLAALYLFFTRVRPTRWALTVAALTALSPLYFSFSHQTMADLPILPAIVLALAAVDRWLQTGCRFGGGAFWLAAGAVGLACATKVQAAVLIATPLAGYLVKRKASPARSAIGAVGLCCVASLPLLLWMARGVHLERAGYHQAAQVYYVSAAADRAEGSIPLARFGRVWSLDELFDSAPTASLRAVAEDAGWRMIPNLAELVVPPLSMTDWRSARRSGWTALLLSAVVLAPVAMGWMVQWRAREGLLSSFYALHVLAIVLAPNIANPRYLVPLIPFTFFYFLIGLDALRVRHGVGRGVAVALGVLCAAALVAHLDTVREHPYATAAQADFVGAALWAGRSLEPDAAILGHNWSELHVLSGRSTYPMLSPPGIGRAPWEEIARRPTYVLLPKADALAAIGARDKCPASWRRWLGDHPDRRHPVFDNTYYRIERLDPLPIDVVVRE
jgi:4-amino-4-deoxy-L-arabinose transferase-like glycosyltransferase